VDEATTGKVNDDEAPTGKVNDDEAPTGKINDDEAPTGKVNDDEAPTGKVNDDETPTAMVAREDDASSEVGESKNLTHPVVSVVEALAGSDPMLDVEEDVEAVPSGEQPPVVQQAAVCGGDDPPELSEYEKLRERNIRERDEAMKEAMEEIEEAKQDMRDNAPGVKKRAAEEEAGGTRKRKKVDPVVEVRRSGRERKPVSYVVEEDLDGRSRKRGRKVGGGRSMKDISKSPPARSGRVKAASKPAPPPTLPSSSRTLRPSKHVDYSEVPEPEADGFIWCSTCN
jgi:hypothetical protein